MSNSITVSIGSNSHDRASQVERCLSWLCSTLKAVRHSTAYDTLPLNAAKNPSHYLNAVVTGLCDADADTLNRQFKAYELQCGRNEQCRQRGIVPIDLDIVMWNGTVVRAKDYQQHYFQIGWQQLLNSHA